MKTIRRLLIANRGEIAARIQRTAANLGIETVAVFSDADRNAAYVARAQRAFRIGPAPANESYLNVDAILDAASKSGADAIHPGYGFLSENADFARRVVEGGLLWVGPSAKAIAALGSKRAARDLAEKLGVPVVLGYQGAAQDDKTFATHARRIGYPVLVKASAGGGGRGMRVVEREEDLLAALESAKTEASSSFGNGELLLERYVSSPRHVEVQILADTHGNVIAVGDRDCSMQRRHQKVVEEAPAPFLREATRTAMHNHAIELARNVGYSSTGTVEFIVDREENFFFLEVNTRLQVEHPVTEAVTGIDLVEAQLRVAEGAKLSDIVVGPVVTHGAAIECRLIAEDPAQNFMPQTGAMPIWRCPDHLREQPWFRLESDLQADDVITPFYDSMFAKVVVHGDTREQALSRAHYALAQMHIGGVAHNGGYLQALLQHPGFVQGELSTGFLAQHHSELTNRLVDRDRLVRIVAAAWIEYLETHRSLVAPLAFSNTKGWPCDETFRVGTETFRVSVRAETSNTFSCRVDGAATFMLARVSGGVFIDASGERWPLTLCVRAGAEEGSTIFDIHDGTRATSVLWLNPFPVESSAQVHGAHHAPTPGRVLKIFVHLNDIVEVGAPLVALEAMKTEHTVYAASAGTVRDVFVQVGVQVQARELLVRISQD